MPSSQPSRARRAISRRALLAAAPGTALFVFGVSCRDESEQPTTPSPAATTTQATTAAPPSSTAQSTAQATGWTFVDDRNKTISLPARPERIVAQTSAAAALWDYGVRPVAIFGPARLSDGSADFQAGNIDLDAVQHLGDYGEMDLEALVALDPQLYVDMALYGDQLWYLGESEARVAEIVPTLGISMQQVPIIDSIRRFEELSGMLGADLQSPEVTRAKADFADAEAELQSAIAARPGLRVLVCSPGPDQIYIASSNWMTDLMYFKQLGLDVIAHPGTDAFEALSWERAHTYPADLVLVDKRVSPADMERINEIPTWSRLPAVAAGQVGPWYAGAPYSHRRFAPIMRELADIIRNCRTDVA